MITLPTASTVLCFGDSNTNGIPSDDPEYARLAVDVRWTGRLQRLLGDDYDVIEEGLSGRTTDLPYDDRPGCDGRPYFGPCLQSHHPIEVVIIMLGTNDMKAMFDRPASVVADALSGYVDDVAANAATRTGGVPRTILVSPIHIDDTRPAFVEMTLGSFDAAAAGKSRDLAAEIARVAGDRGVEFADAATVARAGGDGLHLRADSHEPLARLIASTITAAR